VNVRQDPSQNWDESFVWRNILPPSRPSALQLAYFLPYLDLMDRHDPVLVLGSTTEYRDLLGALGFLEVFVVDKSKTFHERVSKDRFWNNTERVVFQDWRDFLPEAKSTYCAILSDLTSGNIPYEERPHFYRSIASALSSHGLFFDKLLLHQSALRSLPDLYEKYRSLPINLATLNQFNNEVLFTSEILSSGILETTEAYTFLEKFGRDGFWPLYVKENRSITPDNCIWYYGVRHDSVSRFYGSSLQIVAETGEPPDSPYGGFGYWTITRRAR
jgi:hypothetical protein